MQVVKSVSGLDLGFTGCLDMPCRSFFSTFRPFKCVASRQGVQMRAKMNFTCTVRLLHTQDSPVYPPVPP